MNKKLLIIMTIFLLLIAACNNKELEINSEEYSELVTDENDESLQITIIDERPEEIEESGEFKEDDEDFSVIFNNRSITLHERYKTTELVDIFGEPIEETIETLGGEANSHAGSRVKTVIYEDLTIYLYSPRSEGNEFWVSGFLITGDKHQTDKGISIGSSIEELENTYKGIMSYTKDNYTYEQRFQYLRFEVSNGVVSKIEINVVFP